LGGYGPVSDDFPTGFWEKEDEEDEEDAGKYGLKPEDGAPAEVLCEEATDRWAKGGAHEDSGSGVAHVCSSLGRRSDIRNDCHAECDTSRAANCLDHAQEQECNVVCLESETDIADAENNKAYDEG
jgi:hypothetical protein